ncbi:MAG: hypothetical protein ILO68_08500, partial [Clostridia bacterium]|nr:hypothetical protein [Clostridia bacterium]
DFLGDLMPVEEGSEAESADESAEESAESVPADESAESVPADESAADESGAPAELKKNTLSNYALLSQNARDNGYTAMSGEAIIDDLSKGIEIQLRCPRFDMFLVTDYQEYLELAEDNQLVALDTVLSNEAKAIRSYVHSSFFNAAKVGTKTYGVPCNTSIGAYTYIVFDEEILKDSGVSQETLYTLEDLEDFLAIVKEQHPEVIPLANTVTPFEFSYMFHDGFASYVNKSGFVRSTYEDQTINNFLTMIARYKALGYFENENGDLGTDESKRFAVKFMTGTIEEMEAVANEKGYVFNQHSVPIATSENCIDSIYCVSALCPSSWVTGVMEILTELYTDVRLQNTFLYGIENTNYYVDGDQISRINHDYMMNPVHTGNCFIAYTDKDAGDSPNRWANARSQNIDAVESKTIGFTYLPKEYKFGTTLNEENEEVDVIVTEPEYTDILWEVIEPYYQQLITGNAIEFDYEEKHAAAEAEALADIQENLLATYTKRLELKYTEHISDDVIAKYHDEFEKIAEQKVREDVAHMFERSSYHRSLIRAISEDLAEKHEDWDEDKLTEEAEKLAEDEDYVYENYRTIVKKQSLLDNAKESYYNELVEEKVDEERERILSSKQYRDELNSVTTSDKFKEELAYSIEVYVVDTVSKNLDAAISELIKEYSAQLIEECEAKLTEAIDAFKAEYVEKSTFAYNRDIYNEIRAELGPVYLSQLAESGLTGEALEAAYEKKLQDRVKEQQEFIEANAEAPIIRRETALKRQITADYGELSEEEMAEKLSAADTKFDEVYIPLYETFYNAEALALYNIGFTDRSQVKHFTEVTEENPDETPDTPVQDPENPDQPVAGADGRLYDTYYAFVISVKLRAPYYAQFGNPS